MNGKGTSKLAVAIAAGLAVGSAVVPIQAFAKASTATVANAGENADAIIGTGKSADAIIGTGKSADAIIGTGKSADAIIGTGKSADAIIGTGKSADAIIGAGNIADAIIGTGKPAVLLMGAVDAANVTAGTISVLGRTLKVASAAQVSDALASGRQVMVVVSGQISSAGAFEKMNLTILPTEYVAGATQVVVSGRISRIDASLGTMKIGKAVVNISAATVDKQPAVGGIALVVGTQPARQGVVYAEQLFVK